MKAGTRLHKTPGFFGAKRLAAEPGAARSSWLGALAFAALVVACDSGAKTELPEGSAGTTPNATGGSATGGSNGASGSGNGAGTAPSAGGSSGASTASGSLAEKYADLFPIGAALGSYQLSEMGSIVERDLNHLTCENAMKVQDIHPAADTFAWEEADYVADFARQHGMKMTGHALLWHRQAPEWMFEGVTAGDAASLETLKARLKAHIEAMVERYGDVVDNWDVVNEAISDTPSKTYRDGAEGSKWFELFGSEEYIYWAYQYAKDALEAREPGSSAGKLYYNEYLVTNKADRMLEMLSWLKDVKGITVDGVGFQSHEQMAWPTTAAIQTAMDKFINAGYKLKVSELDITVYNDYSTGSFVASPAVELTADLEAKQAKRFGDLFAVYRQNKAHMTSVTFWGVADDQTWLDNEPVPGRNDHPLLYNDAHAPKAARAAIMDF